MDVEDSQYARNDRTVHGAVEVAEARFLKAVRHGAQAVAVSSSIQPK
jgi:hypothetical protein